MVELTDEQLCEIAETEDFSLKKTKEYYKRIKDIPCVQAKDDESLYDCLTILIQDRISYSFITTNKGCIERKSLKSSICDALYRVYDEDATPYLTDEYLEENDIEVSVLRRTFE